MDRFEVALAEPEQHGAVHLGVAAHVVVLLGIEELAVLVLPHSGVAIAQVAPHRTGVPVLALARVPAPAFEQQDPLAGRRQRVRERAAAAPDPTTITSWCSAMVTPSDDRKG